ncbi:hypothetical protein SUGI_1165180 [Cryptomeria japonica]|nr:hypothetical protein SUGI_1165180 [Cryptomeria japonica]
MNKKELNGGISTISRNKKKADVGNHKPDVVRIQETKMSKEKVEKIRIFKENGVIGSNSEGASGGTVLSNVYVPNTKTGRVKYWRSLAGDRLKFADQSWIIMGDFNTPLKEEEKMGGLPLQLDGRQDLMDFINDQALIDMDL